MTTTEPLPTTDGIDETEPEDGSEVVERGRTWWSVLRLWHLFVLYAVLAAASTLTSDPGVWIADARLEFSTDPTGFLAGHGHLWDATRGMGNPATWYSPVLALYQAGLEQLGAPPWIIERLVHAGLLTLAATGLAVLLRVTTPTVGVLHLVAGLVYAFNPYTSQYLVPSGLFFSYALAPWLLACFLRGIRERDDDWRMAAGFALCVFAHGALNSAALLYALLPIPVAAAYVLFAERSIRARVVVAWLVRAAALSLLVACGALVVLWFQRGDVAFNLASTERQEVVSSQSSWGESWRGLGLWLTYFRDSSGQLRPQAAAYFQNPLVVVSAYAAPIAAGLTITMARWRPRWFYAALTSIGLLLMVGVWPPSAPSPFGRLVNWGFENVLLLRGLRTTYKSGSVAMLGVAALAAFAVVKSIRGTGSGRHRVGRLGRAVSGWSLAALMVVAAYPFWSGNVYHADDGFDDLPEYWVEAIDWVNARPEDGRVLVLPGVIRTEYRWGYVNDNLFHGLLDKSLVMHQSIPPPGTPLAADVVLALDEYLSSPDYRPGTVGPILRRLGVRWVLFQNDVDWQRIGVRRPAHFDALRADPDLVPSAAFGSPGESTVARSDIAAPLLGETTMRPVEIYEVEDPAETIRVSTDRPLVVAGAGDAWPQLAQQSYLDGGPVSYTGSATEDELVTALAAGSPVVVTDGSRRRYPQVAGGLVSFSHTLALAESTPRRPRSPFRAVASTSHVVYADAVSIEATTTGSGVVPFDAAQRPALAFDGVPHTAWEVSGAGAAGAVLTARLREPTRVEGLTVQPYARTAERSIGRIRAELVTAGGDVVVESEPVDPATTRPGVVRFAMAADDVVELRLQLEAVDGTSRVEVGIAEVVIADGVGGELDLREFVQTPLDLRRVAGSSPAIAEQLETADVSYSFRRSTGAGDRPEETEIRRRFWAAREARVEVTGTIEITATTPDVTVDRLVGSPVGAFGSRRAPGARDAWGVNAVDGDPATVWLGPPDSGETLTVRVPPRAIGSVEFVTTVAEEVAVDPREFSFVDSATVTAVGSAGPVVVEVEAGERSCGPRADGTRACTVPLRAALPSDRYETIELELTAVTPVPGVFGPRPVAVGEVLLDGVAIDGPTETGADDGCTEAFALDGRSGSVRLAGSRADLLAGRVVAFASCESILLEVGDHSFVSAPMLSGAVSELAIAGPGPARPASSDSVDVEVIERSPTRIVVVVTAPAGSLLLGPGSHHEGWRADVEGENLGRAVPRDALSAWEVPELARTEVELTFRPQRAYELALALTAAGVAVSLVLLLRGRRS